MLIETHILSKGKKYFTCGNYSMQYIKFHYLCIEFILTGIKYNNMKNICINGDCLESLKNIESESIDLVIADPPYWKVIGKKWDYQWKTEEIYIEWSKKWFAEIARVLRIGGTFYCFGYFRTLALLVPLLSPIGLELRQQIIINKGMRSVSGRATRSYKIFPNVTESILFIIKDNKKFIKPFFKARQKELGLTSKEINEALGVKSNGGGMWSIYTGDNICEQFPTRDLWNKLANILKFNLPYEKVAQTFNPQLGYTDVWSDIDFYKEKRYHPTQKPLKLIDRLILASSNKGDTVLDPFSGCGSTQLSALRNDRQYIAIEKDPIYYQIGIERINEFNKIKTLF